MKRIIKIWESAIIGLITITLYGLLSFCVPYNIDYSIERDNGDFFIKSSLLHVLFLLIYVGLMLWMNKIEKSRIERTDAKIIYEPSSKNILVRRILGGCFVVLIIGLVFIGRIEWIMLMFVLYALACMSFKDNVIYGGDDFFIVNGVIYFHDSITEWSFDDLYEISLKANQKNYSIKCRSDKRYSFLEAYFEENLSQSKKRID